MPELERAAQHVAHGAAMGEHAPVVLQDLAEVEGLLVLRLQGLLNFPLHHQADEQADPHQQPEDHPPVAVGADVAAHHRCDKRGERHHQDHERHGAGEGLLLEQVAQQGIDHHRAIAPPAACSIRYASSSGRSPPWRSPPRRWQTSPAPPGSPACGHSCRRAGRKELADGEAAQKGADGELGTVDAGGQIPSDGRNGGQVHIYREAGSGPPARRAG